MKYCPNCATLLELDEIGGRERAHCHACDFVDFGNYGLGVGGVVVQIDDDNNPRVLLIQRNQAPNKGGWTLPGGYVEFDEIAEEAIIREVCEETGFETIIRGVISIRNRIERGRNTTYIVFLLELVDGELIAMPTDEIMAIQFFDAKELAYLEKLSETSRTLAMLALEEEFKLLELKELPSIFNPTLPVRMYL